MLNKIKGLVKEEHGQGMTEYGLVLGVIAIAAIGTLMLLRDEIAAMYTKVLTAVKGV